MTILLRPIPGPFVCRFAVVAFALALTACGGSDSGVAVDKGSGADSVSITPTLSRGAALNAEELAAAERNAQLAEGSGSPTPLEDLGQGQVAAKSFYLSGDVARKAAAVRIPAYRFYNGSTGAHFYTTSETERAHVAGDLSPPFSFDGPAFSVASAHSAGLSSVHRFYSTRTGVHFYTISETERANVATNIPQYIYEGVAYYGSQVAGAGLVPLYRFFVPSRGFHFYTASAAEKATIEATLSATYSYEGIAYYVLDTGWNAREKLPHTGITTSQCYQEGNNTLVACSSAEALGLNPQQDGHRTTIAPMSYSTVPSLFGPYPITSCVRDNVTGLVWEGKAAAGERAGSNRYTNLANNAANDSSGYVAAINAMELCGYTDWRLPTRQELLTIVDYGRPTGAPINTTWFPNTALARYWSANTLSGDSTKAWLVDWAAGGGGSDNALRASTSFAVRLVRGSAATGPRYSFSTVAYGSDAANNVVNDASTGLQWRRCEQGRVWTGSTCTGTASRISNEAALAHAREQTGWRLPNVKELASLVDLQVSSRPRLDQAAFPGAVISTLWASTPYVGGADGVHGVSFYDGFVGPFIRTPANVGELRLVRTSP